MEIIKMLTKKNCYVGANVPSYVVIHETDNWDRGADAKRHAMAMQNGNLAGTVHYYVDSECVYQTLSHEDGAWAVGDGGGRYGITNHNSINIEICVNPESDYYRAVDRAERLAALLLRQYRWGTDRLKRHYDASKKECPRRILKEGLWDSFVKKTAEYMKDSVNPEPEQGYLFKPETIRRGNKGTSVLLLQEILRARGFKGKDGKELILDRTAGENTIYALRSYQESRKGVLEADGVCSEKFF